MFFSWQARSETLLPTFLLVNDLLKCCTTSLSLSPESTENNCFTGLNVVKDTVSVLLLATTDTKGSANPSVLLMTLQNTPKNSWGISRVISAWNGVRICRLPARRLYIASSHSLDSDRSMVLAKIFNFRRCAACGVPATPRWLISYRGTNIDTLEFTKNSASMLGVATFSKQFLILSTKIVSSFSS